MSDPVLEISGLQIALPKGADRPFALDGFDLTVRAGEITCLVGESGSGKSLTAGAVMRLLPGPHVRVSAGSIRFGGQDLQPLSERQMRDLRGNRMAMIFQEPMTALNPQKTVGWQLDEVLRLHTTRRAKSGEHDRWRCLKKFTFPIRNRRSTPIHTRYPVASASG